MQLVPCDAEDAFTATLTTGDGVSIVVDATGAAVASLAPRLVLAGADGVAEVVADGRVVLRRPDGGREEWTRPSGPAGDVHLGPMQELAALVCAAVRGEAPDVDAPTFADGLGVARLLDRVRVVAGVA